MSKDELAEVEELLASDDPDDIDAAFSKVQGFISRAKDNVEQAKSERGETAEAIKRMSEELYKSNLRR